MRKLIALGLMTIAISTFGCATSKTPRWKRSVCVYVETSLDNTRIDGTKTVAKIEYKIESLPPVVEKPSDKTPSKESVAVTKTTEKK